MTKKNTASKKVKAGGRAPRKASGRSTAPVPPSGRERPPSPSRKETMHDRMGRLILEIAAAVAFRKSQVSRRQKPIYLLAFVDGARFVQAANRAAKDERQLVMGEAMPVRIVIRPATGIRRAAKPVRRTGAKRTPKQPGARLAQSPKPSKN